MESVQVDLTPEHIYQALAEIVENDIDDDWATATIHAVVNDEEDVTFQGVYTTALSTMPVRYFRTQEAVYDLILDLRRLLHEPETAPFSEVDFTLKRDGDYDLSFRFNNNRFNKK